MAYQALASRLSTLSTSTKQISLLTQQLATLQPQSASETGLNAESPSPEAVRSDLTAEIHASIKQSEEDLELLKQDVEDMDGGSGARPNKRTLTSSNRSDIEREAARMMAGCAKLTEDMKLARARFRKAQLQAAANAQRAVQKERVTYLASLQAAAAAMPSTNISSAEQSETSSETSSTQSPRYTSLFTGRRPRNANTSHSTNDDILLTATTDVTTSLRRTHALMQSSLSQSQFAHETLESSNAALQELGERYTSFDDLLAKSRGLLGSLLRSNKSDTWYLETAIWLLVGTIGWLLFRRLLYGPAWWFVWQPLKLLWTVVSFMLSPVIGGISSKLRSNTAMSASATALHVMSSVAGSGPVIQGSATGVRSVEMPTSDGVAAMLESSMAATAQPMAIEDAQSNGSETAHGQSGDTGGQQPARRGDGVPLRPREPDEPRNPKKRMLEEPAPPKDDKKGGRNKDEL